MSFLADIYRNFDAHFAEENTTLVSFPNCTEIGSIVFAGTSGCGKYSILSQLLEKFRLPPGASRVETDVQKGEFRNIIFRIPIVDCPENFSTDRPLDIFQNCNIIIIIIDITAELPRQLLRSINDIRESLTSQPEIHVFLHKIDLIEADNLPNRIQEYKTEISHFIQNVTYHKTSMIYNTALLEVSLCIESILPKLNELKISMGQFANSLDIPQAYLVDLQSTTLFLGFGTIDPETFSLVQDGVEMFVGVTTMMDSRNAQATMSVELSNGRFFHFFWPTYDVILVAISDQRIPPATSKNNVIALLHKIRNSLK